MTEKIYNTYMVENDITLFELDRVSIKNIDYVLLLQKQKPNIICIGFIENGRLELVNNPLISKELLKYFMRDEESYKQKLAPFIIRK